MTDEINGVIIKGVGGLYHVRTAQGLYFCRARGAFRNDGVSPLVGDRVNIRVIDESAKIGDLFEILPRRNVMLRPKAANVDAALIVIAAKAPALNWDLLDRFLLVYENSGLELAICVNKSDIDKGVVDEIRRVYAGTGYSLFVTSAVQGTGIDNIRNFLTNKTTALAGPSGVGKSTLINALTGSDGLQTGELSAKIARGKHTTRETLLLELFDNTYVLDTPGFTSLDVTAFGLDAAKLFALFPEFRPFLGECRFSNCAHNKEEGCAVKAEVGGVISPERYKRYLVIAEELKSEWS